MIKPAMTTKPMTPPFTTPLFSPAAKGPAMNALPNACRPADLTAPAAPGKTARSRRWKGVALGLLLGAALLPATEALAQPPLTRVQSFTYDPATALLTQQVSEPDLPGIALTTDYTYDGFGNQLSATVSGPDIASRTTSATFTADGRFMETATNALSHSETHVTDARFGTVTSLTGPNALATTWTYDGFGRKTVETRADGTETRWTYELCVAQCPTGGVYMVTAQDFDSGGFASSAKAIEYLDKLNRVFRSETEGFDGTPVYVDTEYDARGRVHRVSKPYFQGTAAIDILWTTNSYDVLGRLLSVTLPDGGVESTAYNGLTTTLTNALTQTSVRVENALGELVSATDNLSNVTTYSYDSHGNLTETNAAGVITTMTYDIRGLKLTMDDPDMGDWSYAYNALGELTSQTDAKAQVTTMTYDLLGRMATRSEAEGTTTWTYDTAAKGIGKIHTVSAEDPAMVEYYAEAMTYDDKGRPSLASVTVGGETYDTSTLYDTAGRADTLVYPSGFTVKSVFTARGHLAEVTDNAGTLEYWRADTVNAEGQVTAETLGNDVTTTRVYDPATSRIDSISTVKPGAPATTIQDLAFDFDFIGNLTARRDLHQDREEAFTYDGLNRLTGTTLTDTATLATLTNTTYTYDSLGNITNKSDVGVYTYGTGAPGQPGPHAVVSAGGNSYTYDANGSMLTGAGKTTTWTSFNKPGLIVDTLTGDETGFVYGPSRARITQQIIKGGLTTSVTYVGSHFEKKARLGEDDELVHYIRAGATIAIYTEYRDAIDTVTDSKTRYTHRDHLGSIASLTDELGAVTETLSYDPHGKRRLADWQAGSPIDPAETPRGFTGHEHLDAVGLIHMNGRVYDPTLGRFLSADPYVQAPETTQSFNRYSYVHNNPLSYTDPSGFWADDDFSANGHSDPGADGRFSDGVDDRDFFERAHDWIQRQLTFARPAPNLSWDQISGAADEIQSQLDAMGLDGIEDKFGRGVVAGLLSAVVGTSLGGNISDIEMVASLAAGAGGTSGSISSAEYNQARADAHGVITSISDQLSSIADDLGQIAATIEKYQDIIGIGITVAGVIFDVATFPSGEAIAISAAGKVAIRGAIQGLKSAASKLKDFAAKLGRKQQSLTPEISKPYQRPSGATTVAQRAHVQGRPCARCGVTTTRQVAGHRKALVEEYYETGTIDVQRMRSIDAIQPECPGCSAREGAAMSRYSRQMKKELGF